MTDPRNRLTPRRFPLQGAGLLFLVLFLYPPGPPIGSAQTAQDPLAIHLSEVANRFAATTRPAGPIEFGLLAEGDSRFVEIPIGDPRCLSIVAVSEEPSSDLDLHLYAERVEVASHTGIDHFPVVHWCPAGSPSVSLEIRMVRGSGRYAMQVFTAADPPSDRDPDLPAALSALAAQVAQGTLPAADTLRGVMGQGQEHRFQLRLAPARCYVILATGSPTVVDLDLLLSDAGGTVLDADEADDATPVLRRCMEEEPAGPFTLIARMAAGYGEYAILVLGN
ncbi:MAG: hypothetical protein JW797_09435 [Bradymonadales bacterium]|nr:hypothetical protein [Bradymonadales bacterium]